MPLHHSTDSIAARILGIAQDEVRRFGAKRSTMVSIAETAGMTHANVYRYFPSKTALMDAITAAWVRPLEALITEVSDSPDPAIDKLERLFIALARSYRDRLETEPKLFDLFVDAFDEDRAIARQHRSRIRTLLDRVLEEGISSGALQIKHRDRAMTLLLDGLYRFLQPSAIRLDAGINRKSIEGRLATTLTAILSAFRSKIV